MDMATRARVAIVDAVTANNGSTLDPQETVNQVTALISEYMAGWSWLQICVTALLVAATYDQGTKAYMQYHQPVTVTVRC